MLGGFSFALIAIVITENGKLRWPSQTLALLVLAALLLVNAVQAGSIATRWSLAPDQWRDLRAIVPSEFAGFDQAALGALSKHNTWLTVTRITYNFGVAVLLAAIALALVPREPPLASRHRELSPSSSPAVARLSRQPSQP